VEKHFGVCLKRAFPTGFGQVEFEVCFGVDLSTLPTGTMATWSMRYPARILLMLTILTEFPVFYGHLNTPRSISFLDSWGGTKSIIRGGGSMATIDNVKKALIAYSSAKNSGSVSSKGASQDNSGFSSLTNYTGGAGVNSIPNYTGGANLELLSENLNQNNYQSTPSVYATQKDYDSNKSKDPSLQLYDPNKTTFKAGDYFLGGSAAVGSPTDDYLKSLGIQRIYGNDAQGTGTAYDKYLATNQANMQLAPQIAALKAKLNSGKSEYDSTISQLRDSLSGNVASLNQGIDAAKGQNLVSIAQVRRLMDNNRDRTNENLNSQGLLNSGIRNYEQRQINSQESGSIQDKQAELANTIQQIKAKIAEAQAAEANQEQSLLNEYNTNSGDLNSQIATYQAQIPTLANQIYTDKQSANSAAEYQTAKDQRELALKIADLMGYYDGQPTRATINDQNDYALSRYKAYSSGNSGLSLSEQKYYDQKAGDQNIAMAIQGLENMANGTMDGNRYGRSDILNYIVNNAYDLTANGIDVNDLYNWASNKYTWDRNSSGNWYDTSAKDDLSSLLK
jgi:hypothetical protein